MGEVQETVAVRPRWRALLQSIPSAAARRAPLYDTRLASGLDRDDSCTTTLGVSVVFGANDVVVGAEVAQRAAGTCRASSLHPPIPRPTILRPPRKPGQSATSCNWCGQSACSSRQASAEDQDSGLVMDGLPPPAATPSELWSGPRVVGVPGAASTASAWGVPATTPRNPLDDGSRAGSRGHPETLLMRRCSACNTAKSGRSGAPQVATAPGTVAWTLLPEPYSLDPSPARRTEDSGWWRTGGTSGRRTGV